MISTKKLLTFLFCTSFCAVSAFGANNCDDSQYRKTHEQECPESTPWLSTGAILGVSGGLVAVGGAAAVLALASGGGSHGSNGDAGYVRPATVSFNSPIIGGEEYLKLAEVAPTTKYATSEIQNQQWYSLNNKQYDLIGLQYAQARGYTGNNTTIHILDDFDSVPLRNGDTHGNAVKYFAQQIAPNAQIIDGEVSDINHNLNFNKFANIVSTGEYKDIFNASWETTDKFATQATTRSQISAITGEKFLNELSYSATNKDTIFVWAAGNESMSESSALSALPIAVPELQGHFVNVVAYDIRTKNLATYSNQCGITQDYCIAAPVSGLKTDSDPDTGIDGTSFAAPIVSGAVAILRDEFPYLESNKITEILFRTATDLGNPGIDNIYGWGLLDLEKATRPVGNTTMVSNVNGHIGQRYTTATVTPTIAAAIAKSNVSVAVFDDYGRPYSTKLSNNIQIENRGRAFDKLRKINDASAEFGHIEFGTSNVNLLEGDGFMQIDASRTQNAYIAANYSVDILDTKIFTRGQFGILSTRPAPESIINSFSNLFTSSATLGVTYKDLTAEITIPENIVYGQMNMTLVQGRNPDGTLIANNYDIDLSSQRAIEYAMSYKNITAGFIDNPIGKNEMYILAKTKFMF